MIRYTKYGNRDYIVIDSSFEIQGVKAPLHIQINVTDLNQENRNLIYRTAYVAFNRHINFNKPKQESFKKPWWKFFG